MKMTNQKQDKKYTKKLKFLNIYTPSQTMNDSNFHFFSDPQPGYQRISVYRKSLSKTVPLYFELQNKQQTKQQAKTKDISTIIDFQYFSTRQNVVEKQNVVDRNKIVSGSQWVKKYEPHKFIDLLTDDKINRNLLVWLKSWDPIVFNKHGPAQTKKIVTPSMFNRTLNSTNKYNQGESKDSYLQAIFSNPKKMILLAGPPGCGKTTLMRVLANHCKYQIVQINASDDRSANNLINKIQDIAGNDTIRGNNKPALICLDQIDGVVESQAGGILKVIQFIEKGKKNKKSDENNGENQTFNKKQTKQNRQQSKQQQKNMYHKTDKKDKKPQPYNATSPGIHLNRPVIFICNDPFAKSLKQLRNRAHVVYFPQLNSDRIVKRMRQILQYQKVHIDVPVLQKICEICRNDVRSCIGILQLVTREKKVNGKNPNDIINKMKISFSKDNQSTINEFLQGIFFKKQKSHFSQQLNQIQSISRQIMQIDNSSLLIQTFLQNFLSLPSVIKKRRSICKIYNDLVYSDILIKNGFKYHNELDRYQSLPYINFILSFGLDEVKKIQFPMTHFERQRKLKQNKDLLKKIYTNIPIQLRVYHPKQTIIGNYLQALYLHMQTSSTKQSQQIACVSCMLTYNFTLSISKQAVAFPIFSPPIDLLLTYGNKKPQIIFTSNSRVLAQQNYQYFKDRKDMISDIQLRDNTASMINQISLIQRKKKIKKHNGIKYRFVQGTGTKTSYDISMNYFF